MSNILVVDDDPDFRNALSGVLTDAKHDVFLVVNEGEALQAVTRESFDFALIDVRLHAGGEEDESGLSLAIALGVLNPQLRIILLTHYVRTRQVVRAIRYLGVVDFIEKSPDMSAQVLKTIQEATEESQKPRFKKMDELTRLSLFLANGQPLMLRSRGSHVSSMCASETFQVGIDAYARRTEIARNDSENLRFQVQQIGTDLWKEIFGKHPQAGTMYLEARAKSRALALQFEISRDLLSLPLEFTRSDRPAEYLVLQHPLARFVCDASSKREAISPRMLGLTKQLRVLIIASNTKPDIPGVDIEALDISNYLKSPDRVIPVQVKLIPTELAKYDYVKEELSKSSYDIVHYAGHGSFNPESPENSCLYFWSENNKKGEVVPMRATELKLLLDRSEARLAYLSSCYGAASGNKSVLLDDDFLGIADAVAQAGVPSAVGFRWPVSDVGARELALAFYRSLLEQGSPEIALWSARWELAAKDRDDPTWLSPILIHQE